MEPEKPIDWGLFWSAFALWVLVSILAPSVARADDYPAQKPYTAATWDKDTSWAQTATGPWWTQTEACNATVGMVTTNSGFPGVTITSICSFPTPANCNMKFFWNGGEACGAAVTLEGQTPCPSGGTYDEAAHMCIGAPSCPAGQTRNPSTGQCGGAGCTAGPDSNTGKQFSGSGGAPGSACIGGCSYPWNTVVAFPGPPPQWFGWPGQNSGITCTTGTGSQSSPSCPQGQCPGTVNGQSVCVPCTSLPNSTTTENKSSTTTSSGPGGTSTTTENTTTTTTGGTSTVNSTKTVTDGSGTTTTTTTQEKPMDTFCKENPSASICKTSTFGGSCAAGFSCDGDAAQCAVAKEVYKRDCTLFDTETTESTLGRAVVAGTDTGTTSNPALPANRETRAIGSFDQSTFISAPTLSDKTYFIGTWQGQTISVTLPLSNLLSILTWIGNAAVALTLLWAARFALS